MGLSSTLSTLSADKTTMDHGIDLENEMLTANKHN